MTRERRLLIPLGDVVALTIECKKCGARLTYPEAKLILSTDQNCPVCPAQWWAAPTGNDQRGDKLEATLVEFVKYWQRLEENDSDVNYRVLLEIEEPKL